MVCTLINIGFQNNNKTSCYFSSSTYFPFILNTVLVMLLLCAKSVLSLRCVFSEIFQNSVKQIQLAIFRFTRALGVIYGYHCIFYLLSIPQGTTDKNYDKKFECPFSNIMSLNEKKNNRAVLPIHITLHFSLFCKQPVKLSSFPEVMRQGGSF